MVSRTSLTKIRAIVAVCVVTGLSADCGQNPVAPDRIPGPSSSTATAGSFQILESTATSVTNSLVGRFDALTDPVGHGGGALTGPPLNLTATVVGRTVTLAWTAPATGAPLTYIIEVGSAPGMANLGAFNTFSAATTFAGSGPNGTYYLRVKARDAQGDSAPSNEATVTITTTSGGTLQFTAPNPLPNGRVDTPYFFSFCGLPPSVGANCQGTGNPSGGVPPYHFQLDTAGGFPPFGLTLGINGNLTGTPTTPGTRTFSVCAVDLAADSVCRTTTLTIEPAAPCIAPAAPTGLNASVNGNLVTVTWNASAGATSYLVEVGMAPGSSELANMQVGNNTSITGTATTGTYYLRVRARSECGTSPPSGEIVVRVGGSSPPPPPTIPTVSPALQNLGEAGGCPGGTLRATVNVTAPSNISWTADHAGSSVVSWARLSFGPASGTGNGTISVSIALSPQTPSSRSFTCSDVYRFSYGDTITVRFSTGDVGLARINYTYLAVY